MGHARPPGYQLAAHGHRRRNRIAHVPGLRETVHMPITPLPGADHVSPLRDLGTIRDQAKDRRCTGLTDGFD